MNTTPSNPLQTQVGGDHYKKLAIQPVEYIHANGLPFIEGCIIKYATRWRDKDGIDDLEKIVHFAQLLIGLEKSKAKTSCEASDTRVGFGYDLAALQDLDAIVDSFNQGAYAQRFHAALARMQRFVRLEDMAKETKLDHSDLRSLFKAHGWKRAKARINGAMVWGYTREDADTNKPALDRIAELEAERSQLDAVRDAIKGYHHALDTRQHGGVAAHKALDAIQAALGMRWSQGDTQKDAESNKPALPNFSTVFEDQVGPLLKTRIVVTQTEVEQQLGANFANSQMRARVDAEFEQRGWLPAYLLWREPRPPLSSRDSFSRLASLDVWVLDADADTEAA